MCTAHVKIERSTTNAERSIKKKHRGIISIFLGLLKGLISRGFAFISTPPSLLVKDTVYSWVWEETWQYPFDRNEKTNPISSWCLVRELRWFHLKSDCQFLWPPWNQHHCNTQRLIDEATFSFSYLHRYNECLGQAKKIHNLTAIAAAWICFQCRKAIKQTKEGIFIFPLIESSTRRSNATLTIFPTLPWRFLRSRDDFKS